MKPIMLRLMAVAIGLAMLSSAVYGSKTSLTSTDVARIVAPDTSETRVLIRFDLPELPEEQRVYYADIQFHVEDLEPYQEFELYELANDWDARNVSWDGAWDAPGGDVRGKRIGSWITDERTGNLMKFVVTGSVARFMSGRDANNGFLIMTTGEDPQRLALPDGAPVLTIYSGPSHSTRR